MKQLERVMPDYLAGCDWFGGTARDITSLRVASSIHVSGGDAAFLLTLIDVALSNGRSETLLLPVYCAVQDEARRLREESPRAVIANLSTAQGEGALCDGIYCIKVRDMLFTMIALRKMFRLRYGTLAGVAGRSMRVLLAGVRSAPESEILKSDSSAVSVRYGNNFYFKLCRRVEERVNPEVEIGRFLTDEADFPGVAPLVGSIEYRAAGREPVTLGILQGYMPSHSDAWTVTIDEVGRYFERVLETRGKEGAPPLAPQPFLGACRGTVSADMLELLGGLYQGLAELIGRRTGELHLALASRTDKEGFAPEPFSKLYQRSIYQSMRAVFRRAFFQLDAALPGLDPDSGEMAAALLAVERNVLKCLQILNEKVFLARKIRIHGDYNLARLLYTGKDFIITDFEGESDQNMSERRIKRSPMRDVAGMIYSFYCAAFSPLTADQGRIRREDAVFLEPWADVWYRHAAGCFLDSYLTMVAGADFFPHDQTDMKRLLDIFIIERAMYELKSELINHHNQISIPIRVIMAVLAGS